MDAERAAIAAARLRVGAGGIEPPTSRTRTVRSTGLSHAPNEANYKRGEGGGQGAESKEWPASRTEPLVPCPEHNLGAKLLPSAGSKSDSSQAG